MKNSSFFPRLAWATLATGALFLSGCVTPTPATKISGVTPTEVKIFFNAPEFQGTAPQRASYLDDWDVEEYTLFEGGGAVAEVIYAAVNIDGYFILALDYPFTVADSIKTWNFAKQQTLTMGPVNRVTTGLTDIFYRPFQISGTNRSCFGFSADWDLVSFDPESRSGQAMFGYYCAPLGKTLSNDHIATLLDSIHVREFHRKMPGLVASLPPTVQPWQIARGFSPGSKTGNTGFPYRFADAIIFDGGGET